MARSTKRPRRRRAEAASAGDATPAIAYGPLAQSIAFHLRLAHNTALQAFARQAGRAYVRPGRFTLLTLIGENPGISQTTLGRASGLDISTLTPALDDLVRRGLIHRERLPHNRRSYALALTPEGVALRRQLGPLAAAFERTLARAVGTGEEARLLRVLRRIARALGAATTP